MIGKLFALLCIVQTALSFSTLPRTPSEARSTTSPAVSKGGISTRKQIFPFRPLNASMVQLKIDRKLANITSFPWLQENRTLATTRPIYVPIVEGTVEGNTVDVLTRALLQAYAERDRLNELLQAERSKTVTTTTRSPGVIKKYGGLVAKVTGLSAFATFLGILISDLRLVYCD